MVSLHSRTAGCFLELTVIKTEVNTCIANISISIASSAATMIVMAAYLLITRTQFLNNHQLYYYSLTLN